MNNDLTNELSSKIVTECCGIDIIDGEMLCRSCGWTARALIVPAEPKHPSEYPVVSEK